MGHLTTIVLHNDAMGSFEEDPEAFGKAILKAIGETNLTRHRASNSGITVYPSRHADDETLYFHTGNTLVELNQYSNDFCDIKNRLPDYAKELVSKVSKRIDDLAKFLKKS